MSILTAAPDGTATYKLFPVTAKRVELITPHMKRVFVDGTELGLIRPDLPAQWLKVFPPMLDETQLAGRTYTIRSYDPQTNDIALDFFLHGRNGPASFFAEHAEVGVQFYISATHPRSGFPILPSTKKYLLFGDETSLPAIASILESLPANCSATAFVEIADGTEEQLIDSAADTRINWLYRMKDSSSGYALEAMAWGIATIGLETSIFAAGESATVANIRKYFRLGHKVEKALVQTAGYWRQGEADHRDLEDL